MGRIESSNPQEKIDHQQPSSPENPPASHSPTTTISSSTSADDEDQQQKYKEEETPQPHTTTHHTNEPRHEDIDRTPAVAFPPQPSESHLPPLSGHHPQLVNEIKSIPAVAFPPPQPRPPAVEPPVNIREEAGSGHANAPGPVRPGRRQPVKARLILIPTVGNPWSSGLFDCCQHPMNALITTVAPCATFGQNAEIVDNGSTSCLTGSGLYCALFLVICHWNIGVRYRRRVRDAFHIAETPLTDRLAHTLFPLCALCQEFRELKNQGFDPLQGYKGVVAQIQEEMQSKSDPNPPTIQMMTR